MAEGVDYSSTAHSNSPGTNVLKANGKSFVGRYVVNDKSPGGRGIDIDEYRRMVAGGISVFVYWEGPAAWMLGGFQAGVSAAKNAQANIQAAGMPANTPVYFAHDIDPEPKHFQAIRLCVEGAASVIGWPRMGVYGGWLLIDHLSPIYDEMKYYCQPLAWEYDRGLHPAACLYQYDYNVWIDGTNCDLVRSYREDYGQASGPPPPPPLGNRYAEIWLPRGWEEKAKDPHATVFRDGKFKFRRVRMNFKVKILTTRRSRPSSTSRVSGPKYDIGFTIYSQFVITQDGVKGYYVQDQDNHYVLGSKLVPSILIDAS